MICFVVVFFTATVRDVVVVFDWMFTRYNGKEFYRISFRTWVVVRRVNGEIQLKRPKAQQWVNVVAFYTLPHTFSGMFGFDGIERVNGSGRGSVVNIWDYLRRILVRMCRFFPFSLLLSFIAGIIELNVYRWEQARLLTPPMTKHLPAFDEQHLQLLNNLLHAAATWWLRKIIRVIRPEKIRNNKENAIKQQCLNAIFWIIVFICILCTIKHNKVEKQSSL